MQQQEKRKKRKKRYVKALTWVLAFMLVLQTWSFSAETASASGTVTYKGQEIITAGAILKKYDWVSTRNNKPAHVNVNVIEVALENPMVKLDVMTGKGGKFTTKNTVKKMAQETGAVAGVNGDFYNTKANLAPMGPQMSGGEIMATPNELPGFYSFGLTKDNKPVIDMFTFTGSVTAANGNSYYLGGVNKTYYWFEPSGQHSMIDSIFLYTSSWGSSDRANDGVTVPTEVLVQNGIIQDIKVNGIFEMAPPEDGYILRAAGAGAQFVQDNLKIGDPIHSAYNIVPRDPSRPYDAEDFQMMIGGHTILVDNGQPAALSRKDADYTKARARTAIGYSQDEKYVYLINVEDNANSDGMSFAEMQDVMTQIGIWKGMNLDGGGSSQMVARPLGETGVELVAAPESNYQREIVNGIGVYTLAPKGEALGLNISGPKKLFVNESAAYYARGYDTYYNPITNLDDNAVWSSTDGMGTFENNVFTLTQAGKATISVSSGQATSSKEVDVVRREDIESLTIQPSSGVLMNNEEIQLSVKAKLKDGTERTVPAESFQWQIKGFQGEIKGDTLHITDIQGTSAGQLIASYDGFSTILNLPLGSEKLWADFEQSNPAVSFSSTEGVTGEISRVPGMFGLAMDNYAVQMDYELIAETGTLAAYADFGQEGVLLEGEPQSMSVNVWGDNSGNWLRAELIDAAGKTHRVDLAKEINWDGWKTVKGNFSNLDMAYPVQLKRIYIADIEQGRADRARKGTVALDDIKLHYKTEVPNPKRNKVSLTIDEPKITVNGESMTIDQAPVLISGNTLVPVRFVVEALGGEVIPWNEGDTERKVTIFKDGQMAELWLDQLDLVVNGKVVTAEVPPQLMNERTMMPLRILTENFGWKVSWDQETHTVTLE
ncbi:stalk domain-containing protein [Paenibacillus residui]|uniref:Stalk domain-containing protein n=1 Tax=Paenibacillus residui TaxID=629724 RepID=A0ABW3DAX7_9BACL